jgi:hypothetical protein
LGPVSGIPSIRIVKLPRGVADVVVTVTVKVMGASVVGLISKYGGVGLGAAVIPVFDAPDTTLGGAIASALMHAGGTKICGPQVKPLTAFMVTVVTPDPPWMMLTNVGVFVNVKNGLTAAAEE